MINPYALHYPQPVSPLGDEEGAPKSLKPYEVLEAVGNVRQIMRGLLLPYGVIRHPSQPRRIRLA